MNRMIMLVPSFPLTTNVSHPSFVSHLLFLLAANATLQIAVFVLLAKFPPYYTKVYLFGQGCAAVFNSLLQIVTLAIGTSTTVSANIYFGMGSTIMGLTLVLFHFSKYNRFYRYFMEHAEEDLLRDMLSFSECRDILKIIWSVVFMYVFFELAKIPHVPVTSLVVSENYGNGNKWNGKFVESMLVKINLLFTMYNFFRRLFCTSRDLPIW